MNWLYQRAEQHADESMRDFASMKLTDDARALIRAKVRMRKPSASQQILAVLQPCTGSPKAPLECVPES